MNEKTRVDKILDIFRNNLVFSILIVISIAIAGVAGIITNVKSIVPFAGEPDKFCLEIENEVATLLGEINTLEKEEINYSGVFKLNRLLKTFVILQEDDSKKRCQVVQQIESKNRFVKDKVMTIIFKQIELWNHNEKQNLQTSNIKSAIKSMCESLLDFMKKTNLNDKKEIETIKNTIKLCQEQ